MVGLASTRDPLPTLQPGNAFKAVSKGSPVFPVFRASLSFVSNVQGLEIIVSYILAFLKEVVSGGRVNLTVYLG